MPNGSLDFAYISALEEPVTRKRRKGFALLQDGGRKNETSLPASKQTISSWMNCFTGMAFSVALL